MSETTLRDDQLWQGRLDALRQACEKRHLHLQGRYLREAFEQATPWSVAFVQSALSIGPLLAEEIFRECEGASAP